VHVAVVTRFVTHSLGPPESLGLTPSSGGQVGGGLLQPADLVRRDPGESDRHGLRTYLAWRPDRRNVQAGRAVHHVVARRVVVTRLAARQRKRVSVDEGLHCMSRPVLVRPYAQCGLQKAPG
jgi:hypothetical protein